MNRLLLAACVAISFAGPASAQQCLHGADERPEQQVRRRQAVAAARAVNTLQANQPGRAEKRFLRHEELATAPGMAQLRDRASFNLAPGAEIVPGWELTLDVMDGGYWFMIKDKNDPCGFAFISNANGLIYTAAPLR